MNFEIKEFPPLINANTLIHEFSYRITLKPEIIRIGPTNFTGDFELEQLTEEGFLEITDELKNVIFNRK